MIIYSSKRRLCLRLGLWIIFLGTVILPNGNKEFFPIM